MQLDPGLMSELVSWVGSIFQTTSSLVFSRWLEGRSWTFPRRDVSPGNTVSSPSHGTIVLDFILT